MSVIICNLEEKDIPELSALAKQTYTETFGSSFSEDELKDVLERTKSEEAFKQSILTGDDFLIAKNNHKMIGYVGLQNPDIEVKGRNPTDKDQALKGIYVDKNYHRQGLGTKLMNEAFDHRRFRASENIYLCVWEKNKPAYDFYINYGFKKVGTCDVIADDKLIGTDTVMMKAI